MSETAGVYRVSGPETGVTVFTEDEGVLDGEGLVIGREKGGIDPDLWTLQNVLRVEGS